MSPYRVEPPPVAQHEWVHGRLRLSSPWMRGEGERPRQVKGPLGCANCHVLWPPPGIACLGTPSNERPRTARTAGAATTTED